LTPKSQKSNLSSKSRKIKLDDNQKENKNEEFDNIENMFSNMNDRK